MGRVHKIGISKNKGSQIIEMNEVELIKGKGIVDDRHFKNNNQKECQITLIEVENIDNYNKKSGTNIPAVNFRRNIVTKNIRLNELLKKEFFLGNVKLNAHDLCRPCKYLQESLNQFSHTQKDIKGSAIAQAMYVDKTERYYQDLVKNFGK